MTRLIGIILLTIGISCSKTPGEDPAPTPENFNFSSTTIGSASGNFLFYDVNINPVIRLAFTAPVSAASASSRITMVDGIFNPVALNVSMERNDSVVVLRPQVPLQYLTKYKIQIAQDLRSKKQNTLFNSVDINIQTSIDSSDKFPRIPDEELLTLVQRQTFKYFWDFGHPVSGLARERNTSGDVVTSGGSGFGIMAIVAAIHRQFITRDEGLARLQKMVSFLKNNAQKFHGAFPHWLNGATGAVVPFSQKDNGADLVETSYLVQGLLTARQYFDRADATESTLRDDINALCNAVEWSWFRKNNENVLYWHWSPNYAWEMNHQIRGWNECLITYVLAASSPTYSIPKVVYDNGWARNGAMTNNSSYYGYQLPLGEPYGGPLFFAHYSFLGIDPDQLSDAYANYWTQNRNHTLINHTYCKTNPRSHFGYSDSVWGLTASDIQNGYTASSPNNDIGVIAPTAALSSFPYTPTESMKALKFFYYKLGNKIWGNYGFVDAFSLKDAWFASSYLAIDQGPIIVMIENYRSGLLWDLFMSCPEVKTGMESLGFQSPHF